MKAHVRVLLLFSLFLSNSLTPPCGLLQVVYDVRGMLEKNRDTFRDDILNLLRESRSVTARLLLVAIRKLGIECLDQGHEIFSSTFSFISFV